VEFENSAARLWKRLPSEERQLAATAFWKEPPQELLGTAVGAIVRVRRLRPQVARSLPPDQLSAMLASVLDPGEALASALLVALHLSDRRPLLRTFLDAVGLPHEDGLLKDDEGHQPPPISSAQAQAGTEALRAAHPEAQVLVYLNTLWLQDPDRWAALATA